MAECRCDDMERCKIEIAQLEDEALKTIKTSTMAFSLYNDSESLSSNTALGIKSGNLTNICLAVQGLDEDAVGDNRTFFDKIRAKIAELREYYDELEIEDTEYHEDEDDDEDDLLLNAAPGVTIN